SAMGVRSVDRLETRSVRVDREPERLDAHLRPRVPEFQTAVQRGHSDRAIAAARARGLGGGAARGGDPTGPAQPGGPDRNARDRGEATDESGARLDRG